MMKLSIIFFAITHVAAFVHKTRYATPATVTKGFSKQTEDIFNIMEQQQAGPATGAGGAGGSPSLEGLRNLDKAWMKLKDGGWKEKPFEVVFDHGVIMSPALEGDEYDVVVSGGTLGVFYAAALQKIGYKTGISVEILMPCSTLSFCRCRQIYFLQSAFGFISLFFCLLICSNDLI
jgi:hypothetical protein